MDLLFSEYLLNIPPPNHETELFTEIFKNNSELALKLQKLEIK